MKFEDLIRPIPIITPKTYWRFWEKVIKKGENECWIWIGAINSAGRPTLWVNDRTYLAARISYKINEGKDPGIKIILHQCDNPMCMNPKHFRLGNHVDNQLEAISRNLNTCKGSGNGRSILIEEQVIEIKKLLKSVSYKKIAEIFKVSYSTVWNIAKGRNWKHVK